MTQPLLTLCIPTNGVLHWVQPVLESIEMQGVDTALYEIVVTDNGSDVAFKDYMRSYAAAHANVVYRETTAQRFLNQKEAFGLARGRFIKFVNHRMPLKPGALAYLLDFVREYQDADEKPVIYFANGSLGTSERQAVHSFDAFIGGLGIYSSWSGGLAFWREDYEAIPEHAYNDLFPHTDILFFHRQRKTYLLDDTLIHTDLPVGKTAKGRYDLYLAFAVEYPSLLLELVRAGDVRLETFLAIKKKLIWFLAEQYMEFHVLRRPCSYDLSSYVAAITVYFSERAVAWRWPVVFARRAAGKIYHMFFKKKI